jgi:2-oxoglutarate ferredoxin oxidoreductase subunit gamma
MKEEIIISGFGGQGVLSTGKLLAYAAMMEGKEVSWLPAYGPEQRGGTANCTVIISDSKIPSPIISRYTTAILLNQPSIEKFLPNIKPGGTLIYETSGIIAPPKRDDINIYSISAMDTAAEMHNIKTFNMIILGGLIKVKPLTTIDNIKSALYKTLPERHHKLIPLNEQALLKGMEIIEKG